MKKAIILLFILAGFIMSAHAGGKDEQVKTDKFGSMASTAPLQEKLDRVYDAVKDYNKADITIGNKEIKVGKLIKDRCLILLGAFLLIYFGIKVLPVMYSPDKELDSMFWVKPVFLALLISCYSPCMSFVDYCMKYLSFRDMTKNCMAATKAVQEQVKLTEITEMMMQKQDHTSTGGFFSQYSMLSTSNGNFVSSSDVNKAQHEFQKKEEVDKAIEKLNDGNATEDDEKLIDQAVEEEKNDSLGVKIVKAIVSWIGDIIAIIARVYQTVVLCVLYLGGPIAIMLEVLPPFKGSLKKWFGMYVHTCMWTPVFFVIDVVSLKLYNSAPSGFAGSMMAVSFQIVMVVLYAYVGKITGYFVEAASAGAGDLHQGGGDVKKRITNAGSGAIGLAKGLRK